MFPLAFVARCRPVGGVQVGRARRTADDCWGCGCFRAPTTGRCHTSGRWCLVSDAPRFAAEQETILSVVISATWYSLRVAVAAFVIGTLLGLAVAVLMARFKLVERGLMPYLIMSQTVPIIVLGPVDHQPDGIQQPRAGGQDVDRGDVARRVPRLLPVAVATLRGLQSTPPAAMELMESFASPWWRTLLKLRFPAAVPFIAPALRIAGAAAVVGVVVAEISLGIRAGVGPADPVVRARGDERCPEVVHRGVRRGRARAGHGHARRPDRSSDDAQPSAGGGPMTARRWSTTWP